MFADDPSMVEADELLHLSHLAHLKNTPVSDLSHGQQRQLEIGMALAGTPKLILLDEPAAGLSPMEREELVEILRALPEHVAYIIIEHDLDVALRVVDYVTVMHEGAVYKEGTPDEIQSDPDVQRIYLGESHG